MRLFHSFTTRQALCHLLKLSRKFSKRLLLWGLTKYINYDNVIIVTQGNTGNTGVPRKNNPVVINDDTKTKVDIEAGENSTVKASGGNDENIDLKDSKNTILIADNGAKVTNYDPSIGTSFLMSGFSNILAAIRNQSLTFDDNIRGGRRKCNNSRD